MSFDPRYSRKSFVPHPSMYSTTPRNPGNQLYPGPVGKPKIRIVATAPPTNLHRSGLALPVGATQSHPISPGGFPLFSTTPNLVYEKFKPSSCRHQRTPEHIALYQRCPMCHNESLDDQHSGNREPNKDAQQGKGTFRPSQGNTINNYFTDATFNNSEMNISAGDLTKFSGTK